VQHEITLTKLKGLKFTLVNGLKIVLDWQQVSLSHSITIFLSCLKAQMMPAAATRNQHN